MSTEPSSDLSGLSNLHTHENDVYAQHHRAAVADPHMRSLLRVIENSLDFMIDLAGAPLHTTDARTVSAIAGRIFNTTAGALREALNGYPQTSLLLQRDLVEIHTLLDVFSHDLTRIARWAAVTNAERREEFSPGKLRRILEERDGAETARIRKEDYQVFSEHAAHLTFPALRMLQLPSGATQLGPRHDAKVLRECLHELGRRVLLVSLSNARVMLMLHQRDGQPIAANLQTKFAEVDADGMRVFKREASLRKAESPGA